MQKQFLQVTVLCLILFWVQACGQTDSQNEKKQLQEIYNQYRQALQTENIDQLKKLVCKTKQKELSSPNARKQLKLIKQFSPKNITIEKVTIKNNKGVLKLVSAMGAQQLNGKAEFIREENSWKLLKENWVMKVDLTGESTTALDSIAQPFFQDPTKPPQPHRILKGHQGEASSLQFSPGGKYLISSSYGDYTIRIWNSKTGKLLSTCKSKNRPKSLSLLKKKKLMTADAYQNIMIWPVRKSKIKEPKTLIAKAGDSIALPKDEKIVASTAFRKPISIWNIKTKEKIKDLPKSESARILCFSPSGKELVSGGDGNFYSVWDRKNWQEKRYKIAKVQGAISSIDISRDGKILATGHTDSSIVIHDFKKRRELHNFYVRNAATSCVRLSPDSKILATANKNIIYLWDVKTGKQLARLTGHKDRVVSLAFSNDGQTLASGGEDRQIIIWRGGPPPKTDAIQQAPRPIPATIKPGKIIAIAGHKNLARNTSANEGFKLWRKKGEVSVEPGINQNPLFALRYNGYLWQDSPVRKATGKYVLLAARAGSERFHKDGDQTGYPYLYGYWINSKNRNKFNGYLNGQNLLFKPSKENDWGIAWGIFKVPPETGAVRLFLQQADGHKSQNGSAAYIDDVGIYLLDTESDAKQFFKKYQTQAEKIRQPQPVKKKKRKTTKSQKQQKK